LDNVIDIV